MGKVLQFSGVTDTPHIVLPSRLVGALRALDSIEPDSAHALRSAIEADGASSFDSYWSALASTLLCNTTFGCMRFLERADQHLIKDVMVTLFTATTQYRRVELSRKLVWHMLGNSGRDSVFYVLKHAVDSAVCEGLASEHEAKMFVGRAIALHEDVPVRIKCAEWLADSVIECHQIIGPITVSRA